jgi:lipopolysaccharide biosynthesis glycosyltransferase
MLDVFIGWDSREQDAYKVCEYSIRKYNSKVRIRPLKQQFLRKLNLYTRPTDEQVATEFAFTRFMVPWMMKYQGIALFCDCDMLFNTDVEELLSYAYAQPDKAIHVVQHDYVPRHTIKMDGQVQQAFPRKNWSSFILWNCGHPSNAQLTLNHCNEASGAELHQFQWLRDEEIGWLPITWNWLEGEYEKPTQLPNVIHYTNGGAWFKNHQNCDYAKEWVDTAKEMGLDY